MRAFREPHDFMKHTAITLLSIMTAVFVSCSEKTEDMPEISGIYPHLAFYNNEAECGTGAVVPWNGTLWALTYAPHSPYGSSDKLYSISSDMTETCHRESIGGTPASRLIHRESGQLFIGPYAIDGNGNITYSTPEGSIKIPSAVVGNDGASETATQQRLKLEFTGENITKVLDAKSIAFEITVSGMDENAKIKLRTTDSLSIKISAFAKAGVTFDIENL